MPPTFSLRQQLNFKSTQFILYFSFCLYAVLILFYFIHTFFLLLFLLILPPRSLSLSSYSLIPPRKKLPLATVVATAKLKLFVVITKLQQIHIHLHTHTLTTMSENCYYCGCVSECSKKGSSSNNNNMAIMKEEKKKNFTRYAKETEREKDYGMCRRIVVDDDENYSPVSE
jgi:hypothetical protein